MFGSEKVKASRMAVLEAFVFAVTACNDETLMLDFNVRQRLHVYLVPVYESAARRQNSRSRILCQKGVTH